MKKFITIVLTLSLMLSLVSCGTNTEEKIKVGTLSGPTGMGMVKLCESQDKYDVSIYQNPNDVTSKLLNGDVNIAAIPSNLASVLYNKTDGNIVVLTPITLGVLYILENGQQINDVKDLKGRTIIASGKGGTPEYVLELILKQYGLKIGKDVKVKWLSNHNDVCQSLLSKEGNVGMVPEPFVSIIKAKANDQINISLDLNKLWKKATKKDLPMGVLVGTKSYVSSHKSQIDTMLKDLDQSVNFVNNNREEAVELISKYKIINNKEVAINAIPTCNIVDYIGDEKEYGIDMLRNFYQILYDFEPSSVGGKLPNEEFYY